MARRVIVFVVLFVAPLSGKSPAAKRKATIPESLGKFIRTTFGLIVLGVVFFLREVACSEEKGDNPRKFGEVY